MLIEQVREEKRRESVSKKKRKDYVPLLSQYWNATRTYTARACAHAAARNLLHCFYLPRRRVPAKASTVVSGFRRSHRRQQLTEPLLYCHVVVQMRCKSIVSQGRR